MKKGDLIIEKANQEGGESIGVIVSAGSEWLQIHWLQGVNGKPGGTWGCPVDIAQEALDEGEWILREGKK